MDDLLTHALAAVEDASFVCRHVQRKLDVLRAMTKDDASPVTIADYASQAIVARGLSRAGILLGGMVAEESADFLKQPEHAAHLEACVAALRESGVWPQATADEVIAMVDLGAADPAVLSSAQGGWTLDPVDGTKGFLRGEQYCVSLAMLRHGQVEHGLLGCPNLPHDPVAQANADSPRGCSFVATSGQGTTMSLIGDESHARGAIARQDLGPNDPARLSESVETSHTRQDVAAQIMRLAGPVGTPVQMDSQCKYALLARGDADVYLRLPSKRGYVERIWDHAAGKLIAEEAGCVVTDIRGRALDFSRGRGLEGNEGILGAPPALHARLLDAIRQVVPGG
jgi:HAL2 family 3'(2'),5'-bisphosphate nucleotidase